LILLNRGEGFMTEITALKADPGHPSRVEVFLDGRLWRAVPAAAAAGLHVGMSIDAAAQQALEARSSEAAALERVGRLLVIRPRSEAEVRQRLQRAGHSRETTDRVIERLRRTGDLDDGAFARAWVENRMTFRPRGAVMLRAELRRKGVAPGAIDNALSGLDESEAAWIAAQRAARGWTHLEDDDRRRKVYAYLRRRGFDHETIRLVLRRLEAAGQGESEENL
jgi:regulatory protein